MLLSIFLLWTIYTYLIDMSFWFNKIRLSLYFVFTKSISFYTLFIFSGWDTAVTEASDIYKGRMHNLFCDNCHSHVATALNIMHYDNSYNWNMVKLALFILIKGKYVSVGRFIKTWLPFTILATIVVLILIFAR